MCNVYNGTTRAMLLYQGCTPLYPTGTCFRCLLVCIWMFGAYLYANGLFLSLLCHAVQYHLQQDREDVTPREGEREPAQLGEVGGVGEGGRGWKNHRNRSGCGGGRGGGGGWHTKQFTMGRERPAGMGVWGGESFRGTLLPFLLALLSLCLFSSNKWCDPS
eukprot:Sspe_Gene.64626::Locus_38288_Transcript_1_2_Confidence_0.500_Length_622::g.64626::m.64626